MFKKIFIFACFIFSFLNFTSVLYAMQPNARAFALPLHKSMLEFAHESGIQDYEEAMPIPDEHDKCAQEKDLVGIQKFFTQCEREFSGSRAAAAKMYLFLQIEPSSRIRYEDFFLKNINAHAFLGQCPDFAIIGAEGWSVCRIAEKNADGTESKVEHVYNVFELLKNLSDKSNSELQEWIDSEQGQSLCNDLMVTNNVPCLNYLMCLLMKHKIQPSQNEYNEHDEYLYELFNFALRWGSVTSVRFFLDCCKLDANYQYLQSEIARDRDGNKILDRNGSEVEIVTNRTIPLFIAIARGNVAIVRLLLEHDAHPDVPIEIQYQAQKGQNQNQPCLMSAIDLAESMHPEVRSKEIIRLLYSYVVPDEPGMACHASCVPMGNSRACSIM